MFGASTVAATKAPISASFPGLMYLWAASSLHREHLNLIITIKNEKTYFYLATNKALRMS